ncbi:CubicO group peptidase (beta-lactamase class C family) [Saccharothrix saharensis]|uniref:CubicO group peptidase (Beta-lactamase class C family) n=1 Tax=Saccharothrix saharensis TaxID=571190 RepID=A0A543JQ26_9PSEU|nr:serine hydrolase domain-containing protein [Saccharothrix saharensis]TQM84908.1 CubicO group peptidase (beta-lactamase class C family) [Saccharothrix saharensis]
MAEIRGTCDERFGRVRDTFAASLAQDDVGASVAVYVDGEPVVDLWGGHVDATRTTPWERDTIVNVWSTTKTMVALCALILADRGVLDLDAPVADYWPEFAAAGKGGVRVRHVLGYTAGLPTWAEPITVPELFDREGVTARLAAQPARWAPGAVGCYHPLTQGFLIGEVVRRVTGRTLGAFFAEEVAGPLGADFHIGLPVEHDHRVAPVLPPPGGSGSAAPGLPGEEPNPAIVVQDANRAAWRRAEIPSAGGHGNARSVGLVQSVLASGGAVGGVRLLSAAGCLRVLEEQFRGVDHYLGVPIRYGIGYRIEGRTCSWGGWGGSVVVVDLNTRMTVAYVMNQMLEQGALGDNRGLGIVLAAYHGLATAA